MALVSRWGHWRPFTLLCLPSATPLPVMDDHTSPRYHPPTFLVVCLYVGPHQNCARDIFTVEANCADRHEASRGLSAIAELLAVICYLWISRFAAVEIIVALFLSRVLCMPWQDVRLSVTRCYCVQTAKHIIELFSPSGSHTILVFLYYFWQHFDRNPLALRAVAVLGFSWGRGHWGGHTFICIRGAFCDDALHKFTFTFTSGGGGTQLILSCWTTGYVIAYIKL